MSIKTSPEEKAEEIICQTNNGTSLSVQMFVTFLKDKQYLPEKTSSISREEAGGVTFCNQPTAENIQYMFTSLRRGWGELSHPG